MDRTGNAFGRAVALLSLAALALGCSGCGYHVVGHGALLPKTWHSIAVPVFANRTSHDRLNQRFTEAVVRELEERTRYRVVPDPRAADAVLRGELDSIEAVPVLFDSTTGRATTMLVTVAAKVRLQDRQSRKIIFEDDNFVLRDEYELSTSPGTFFDEQDPALGRMARDFASRLLADLLEGF